MRPADRYRHRVYETPTPLLPALLSQAEMVARIELARLEDAPAICPACGCSAGASVMSIRLAIEAVRRAS